MKANKTNGVSAKNSFGRLMTLFCVKRLHRRIQSLKVLGICEKVPKLDVPPQLEWDIRFYRRGFATITRDCSFVLTTRNIVCLYVCVCSAAHQAPRYGCQSCSSSAFSRKKELKRNGDMQYTVRLTILLAVS